MKQKKLFSLLMAAMCSGAMMADPIVPAWQVIDNPVIGGEDQFLPQTQSGSAIYGDYDNDGDLDMFFCTGDVVALFKNNGNMTYTMQGVGDDVLPLTGCAAVWVDYDKDGDLDVIMSGSMDGSVTGAATYVFQNSGAPDYAFTEDMFNFIEGVWPEDKENTLHTIALLDYDHDGWMDVIVNGQCSGLWDGEHGRMTAVYHNNKGVFEVGVGAEVFHQMNGSSVFVGDANNDGFMDVLVSGYYDHALGENVGSGVSELYINDAQGSFTKANGIPFVGHQQGSTLFADLNNDGNLDIIEVGRDLANGWMGYANIMLGDGKAHFNQVAMPDITGGAATTVAVGDLNNDGFIDFAHSGWAAQAICYGKGDGSFKEVSMATDLDRVRARGGFMNFVDLDGDNTLDFYHFGYRDGGDSEVLHDAWPDFMVLNRLGNGIPANRAPSAPANLTMTETADGYLLTWEAAEDDITPAAAMRYNICMSSADGIFFLAQADIKTGKLRVGGAAIPALHRGTSYLFKLPKGQYGFGVQAVDQSNATSPFALVGTMQALDNVPAGSGVHTVFDAMGRQVNECNANGIYIIHYKDGTCRKVIR
ncbi:MAG: VCBS repeat-containing protein [Paludibacteraceae bacterium]|nr:VCBS repeat-containing protein [Paludibacteraceae bacterium]